MTDDIELPPIPEFDLAWGLAGGSGAGIKAGHSHEALVRFAEAAVKADRQKREKPERKVHSVHVRLSPSGAAWLISQPSSEREQEPHYHVVALKWDDSRVWVDSEANRELAENLRYWIDDPLKKWALKAADALDGGHLP